MTPLRRWAVAAVALYGLRWAGAALRTQRRLAPLAAAGDRDAQASVTQRPEANLFGIPNSAYGIVYYGLLLALTLGGRNDRRRWQGPLRLVVAAALARSGVLVWHLWRTRTWCAVCMRGHAANVALALLLLPGQDAHD